MGIDAIILATTAKRATASEIVEWGRRLRSACGHVCEDYEAVPTEARPDLTQKWSHENEEAGDIKHTGDRTDHTLGGLVIKEVQWYEENGGYGDYTFEPAPGMLAIPTGPKRHFAYEICTLQRSAWFDDDAHRFASARGHVPAIVQAATALALLMDPTVVNHRDENDNPPLGYVQRDDWRVWLGNDSSYHMEEFDHATRVELFEAYIRSGLVGDGYWGGQSYPGVGRFTTTEAKPCPVCGCKWRYTGDLVQPNRVSGSDAKSKCPACYHGFATGKKMDDHRKDKPTFPSAERFRDMTPHEREVLVRGLGEALQEAGVGEAANYLTSWVSPDLDK